MVAALILGKVVLIADMLPFINRYPEKPLIYNVLWKTAIYTLVSLALHYLEHLVEHWRKTGSLAAGNRQLLEEIVWPRFAAVQIMLVSLIFVYCVAREVTRVLGPRTVREMFFGSPVAAPLARTATKKVDASTIYILLSEKEGVISCFLSFRVNSWELSGSF